VVLHCVPSEECISYYMIICIWVSTGYRGTRNSDYCTLIKYDALFAFQSLRSDLFFPCPKAFKFSWFYVTAYIKDNQKQRSSAFKLEA
jgi:hypothetical protein